MGRKRKIKELSQILPEEIIGFEDLFDAARNLKAVRSLNGIIGDVILTDTNGNALTVNPDTLKIAVTNATQLKGVDLADDVGTPTDNDVLTYDAGTGNWNAEPAGAGSGEANTASSAGVGSSLFYQKSGVDLQFNAIKSENNRLTCTVDGVTHDVELTVNEANIDHDALTNFLASEHFTEASINHTNITAGDGSDHSLVTNHDARHITAGADEIDGDKLDIDWNPSNYTPATTPVEVDSVDNLTAHLYGVDQKLADSHTRSHAVTGTSDHTANNWKVLHTNGSGQVAELALGTANQALMSSGASSAPTFEDVFKESEHVTTQSASAPIKLDANGLIPIAGITSASNMLQLPRYQVYDATGGTSITGTEATINLDTEAQSHADFSLLSDVITVDYAGLYLVSYYVTWELVNKTGGAISLVECHMEYKPVTAWTNHSRSYSLGYAYEFTNGNVCGGTGCQFVYNQSSDNKELRLRIDRVEGTTNIQTTQNRTMVNIVRLS